MTINPSDDTLRVAAPSTFTDEAHPERIGPYRIERVLGQGGMGLEPLAAEYRRRQP